VRIANNQHRQSRADAKRQNPVTQVFVSCRYIQGAAQQTKPAASPILNDRSELVIEGASKVACAPGY
jgi:hypothetical protein